MNALHEPYLLSSYTPPLRSISKGSFVIDVTCIEYDHKVFATVTVQGDGIHVLETSEMRPVISHTLGPDTRFICPSVTQIDASGTLSTYAVINRPNTTNEGSKYFLRKWTDSLLDNDTCLFEKKSSPNFIENIHRMHTIPKWPSKLIALSVSSHVYVLSTETLDIDRVFRHSTSTSILFRSFTFSPESCTFASRRVDSDGTLIICFVLENNSLFVNLCLLSYTAMKEIASNRLCPSEGFADLTCSTSGYIVVLTSSGTWSIFRLDEEGQLMIEATVSNQPLRPEVVAPKYRGFAVTAITSSFVLLACIDGSTNLHFTLLDLRFSVILATQTFALPSNLTIGPKNSFQVKLVAARQTEIVIRVSPSKISEGTSPRSAIFILPITVSRSSSIALAMGKASEAQVWPPKTKVLLSQEDAARQGLLGRIEAAIKKGIPQEADAIFFTWVEAETRIWVQDKVMVDRPDSKFSRRSGHNAHQEPKFPKLSYRFVTSLLDIVLQPEKASNVPFSSKIPLYLIERKAVSENMIQGGFMSTLRRKGDWKSICAALRNMADIPEQEVINLLIKVLAGHKRSSGAMRDGDAMDTGPSDEGIPTLANFLPMVIQYQSSSPVACYALKTCLSNVDDVILILQELYQILETACKQDFTDSAAYPPSLPPLRFIFAFMQAIFDAHFLTLLQHLPARPLLKQISGRLQEIVFMLQEFDHLREPLNTVIQAQTLARTTGQRESKRDKKKDSFSNIIGLYQVEELVL